MDTIAICQQEWELDDGSVVLKHDVNFVAVSKEGLLALRSACSAGRVNVTLFYCIGTYLRFEPHE
jgi:hypothetical protein